MALNTQSTPKTPYRVPFNKPYLTGLEQAYVQECFANGHFSGNGFFTKACEQFFENRFGFPKALMTTSCTDALEMAALLLDLQPGDEVIVPSYTFVSTANAFMLRGATIVFADSEATTPNIDAAQLETLITERTRAIVVVHYAGMACPMAAITALAKQYGVFLIEDAAHAIGAAYQTKSLGTPLGRFGQMATFSFHETKNIICGEGGMLVINDPTLIRRAEIIREKGTDRNAFLRGEVDKYTWQDIGSSFLPPDYVSAFLWAQLQALDDIQEKRVAVWQQYQALLAPLAETGMIQLPQLPTYATNNAHLFYLLCQNLQARNALIDFLKTKGIQAVFHYLPLHQSPHFAPHYHGATLHNTARYADCLVRLPLYTGMTPEEVRLVAVAVYEAFARVLK